MACTPLTLSLIHISGGFQKGSKVSFTLDGAQNYTGKALASYNSGELTVSARPAEIVLDYESIILAKAGTEKGISVRVKDSEGNYMEGVTAVSYTHLLTRNWKRHCR